MKDISRREALSSFGKGSAGLALGAWGSSVASAHGAIQADTLLPRVFNGNHQPRPLPFDPSKLKGLSEKLIRSHWENNYVGAVNALNAVEKRLGGMFTTKDLPPYIYGDLKREELVRTGSVVLHEMYFANLGGDNKPGGKVLDASSNPLTAIQFGSTNSGRLRARSVVAPAGLSLLRIPTLASFVIIGRGITCTTYP